MNNYELVTAVFEVKDTKQGGNIDDQGKPKAETLCVMRYVRLEGGLSRGAAIEQLKAGLTSYYRTSKVEFKFWCNGTTQNGGSPIVLS